MGDKLNEKLSDSIIEGLSTVIGERTKKGLYNAGDLSLTQIVSLLSHKCEKGDIGIEEVMEYLNGLSYTKDLTKYLGRTKKVKFSYSKERTSEN